MSRLIVLLIAVVLAAGCSSVRVTQDYAKGAEFARYQAFAWATPSHPESDDPRLANPLLHERIHAAVEDGLRARGFRLVNAAEADLLMRYHTAVRSRVEYQRSGVTIGTGYYSGRVGYGLALDYPYGSRDYDEGTLIIDFLDPATGDLVWRGTGVRPLEETPTPERRDEIVRDVVERILAQYPPTK
jgi:hypothetical protein